MHANKDVNRQRASKAPARARQQVPIGPLMRRSSRSARDLRPTWLIDELAHLAAIVVAGRKSTTTATATTSVRQHLPLCARLSGSVTASAPLQPPKALTMTRQKSCNLWPTLVEREHDKNHATLQGAVCLALPGAQGARLWAPTCLYTSAAGRPICGPLTASYRRNLASNLGV